MRRNPLPDGSMNLYELTVIGWSESLALGALNGCGDRYRTVDRAQHERPLRVSDQASVNAGS